jgi:single-strand DNA-binding protein
MNNITLVGRVGRDPEMKFSQNGLPIVNFSIATEYGKDEKKKTTWHNIVVFDKLAENVASSVTKGSRVIVAGRIEISEYETKDGEKKKKTELIADAVGLELRYEPVQSVYVLEETTPEDPF